MKDNEKNKNQNIEKESEKKEQAKYYNFNGTKQDVKEVKGKVYEKFIIPALDLRY